MRYIFTDIFENQPLDPRESARRGARPQLRKRFYQLAHVGEAEGGSFSTVDVRRYARDHLDRLNHTPTP